MYQLLRWGAIALGLLVTSCQWVSSVEVYQADPLEEGCVLPPVVASDTSKGKVRLANLLPSKDYIDICVRPTGTSSYGRPILRTSGRNEKTICGSGLKYGQVTIPFAVPLGKIDVKVVPATKTCSATALTESIGTIVTGPEVATLAYMGGSTTAPTIVGLDETPKPTASGQQNRKTRLVNAIAGKSLIFGTADTTELPTKLAAKITKGAIDFGKAPDPNSNYLGFQFDKNGYFDYGSVDLNVVAVEDGTQKALLLANQAGQGVQTLFAIGEFGSASSAFAVRGLLCREADIVENVRTACDLTSLETFAIDVWNAGLYGAFAVAEEKRAQAVIDALAARGAERSDVACITEIARHDGLPLPANQTTWTQENVIVQAKKTTNGYQYFAQSTTDLSSSITDPANQNGDLPTPPTLPPCNPSVEVPDMGTTIDAAYTCLAKNCSTTTDNGGFDGVTQGGTACYSNNCTGALAGWRYGGPPQQTCFNCMISNGLSYVTWTQNKQACTTDKRTSYAFNGTPTSLMMSKYPLLDVDQYVLGSTLFRRVALYARMQYATDTSIDVYCIHMTPLLGANIPYTGFYGGGSSVETGAAWQDEQIWATKNIIEWIKRKSGDRPAIIAGDWSSSATAVDDLGNVILGPDMLPAVADVNPETVNSMRAAFFEAIPDENYKPKCTRCPKLGTGEYHNPYNNGLTDPQLTLRVFIKEPWSGNPTTDNIIFFNDNVVQINDPNITNVGPLSDTFGLQVRIARP